MDLRKEMRKGMVRRSRALVISPRFWKSRIVFWAGAVTVGLVSLGFARAADESQRLFQDLIGHGERAWIALLLTPAGFVFCAWAAARFFPGTQGSGIPQAIAARHLDRESRGVYLTIRLAAGKLVLTLIGLLCGASSGREGPTVQIGAAIMLLAARIGGMAQARGLILAGSAAGVAAAFNTPLAGIVFAIEEMSRSYSARTNGVVLSAVIIAGVTTYAIDGSYTYYGETDVAALLLDDWPIVLATGIAGGLLGAVFTKGTLWCTRRIRRIRRLVPGRRLVAVAAATGLVVALAGLLTHGDVFGTSYEEARGAVEGQSLSPLFFIAKFVATLATTVSGIPGGLFAPSLSVGAGLGNWLGQMLGADLGLATVLGMAGYFAGVVQAPMTAFIIVVEMTGSHDDIIPIMTSAMLGYGLSRIVCPEPLYHALSRLWIADAIRARRAIEQAAREEDRAG
ncbi:chloride channel protein [Frigidibacter sp. MR17.24]|uniref:chloride channel protein n=1 Tax=Frigidibacter sp. MR17.24 TaxID=3127345 RepID=UPI0030130CEF